MCNYFPDILVLSRSLCFCFYFSFIVFFFYCHFRLPVQLVHEENQKGNVDEGHENQRQKKGDNQRGQETIEP